jgi:hypothetical protein
MAGTRYFRTLEENYRPVHRQMMSRCWARLDHLAKIPRLAGERR